MKLDEYLQLREANERLATEDVLASFLPLVRETIQTHRAGMVAPLEGLQDLHFDQGRLWFEEAQRKPLRRNASELARVELASRVAVEVLGETRRTLDVGESSEEVILAEIGTRGQPVPRTVYLPGYVSWEHELQHHDPLTDIFSLGLLLATMACGLNLNNPDELQQFVSRRRNLFALHGDLHPTLAQAIWRMTELDRHRRAQDLHVLLASLENYRDQTVSLEIDLARLPGLLTRDRRTRSQAILGKLRDRLFDLSRRNSLLHFRSTLGTLNLTQSSIPLTLDIRNIREDQLFLWNADLRQRLADSEPISLNRHLNFAEAVYLPSVLERIIGDARRDQQEFGFAQLRLVLCFLSWADLKQKPPERYMSPLVLLPVRLWKTKGIRDTYQLESLTSEAEINPVLRHQFRQLYNIDLPETIDLAEGGLESLFDYLSARIQASEPAVTLSRIDRPRIDLIHQRARRRLDQYRRNARVSGRGVRSFASIDYSYDAVNYHPLGIRLFSAKIRGPSNRLREIIEQRPRPRAYMTAEPESDPESGAGAETVEKERAFFHLRDASEENPYLWNFDLCSLTLANFRYRRMSLVRDYEAILEEAPANAPFEATFSLTPRPVGRELPPPASLEDRFDVLPCDPTQASAIAEARSGIGYIIQGPPGTGKSQTIANLIADFVARGQRILFVCEKRAALDVVYARLRQCGLGSLCCLIHDSQTDKKEFVLDLKQTYEQLLEDADKKQKRLSERDKVLQDLRKHLLPLEQFEQMMVDQHPLAGMPARQLLSCCMELQEHRPELTPEQQERLPPYCSWHKHRDRLAALEPLVRELARDGVLARHPLRLLAPRLADADRPMEEVRAAIPEAREQFSRLLDLLRRAQLLPAECDSLSRVRELVEYGRKVASLARNENLLLLQSGSTRAKEFARSLDRVHRAESRVVAARKHTVHWRTKLPADEVVVALEQARQWERARLAILSPSWWRLRGILKRSYNFPAHTVRPTWTQVLTALQQEHESVDAWEQAQQEAVQQFHLPQSPSEVQSLVQSLRPWLAGLPEWIRTIHNDLLKSTTSAATIEQLLAAGEVLAVFDQGLARVLVDYARVPLSVLGETLLQIEQSVRQVPDALALLKELGQLPPDIGRTLRELPVTIAQAEAAVAHATWLDSCRQDRELGQWTGGVRERHVDRLEKLYDSWLTANAAEIRRGVRERFLENVQLASTPAAQLPQDQREAKKAYSQGRRVLEHEFGKSMRFRAIRDLVDGDSGLVVRDLKPVWLMSPLSVSDTLPLATDFVDVVIFDEASQVQLEDAVPSLFRSKQVIVVGDEMQLPPTDFFSTRNSEEDDALEVTDGEQVARLELGSDSFLNHAAKNLRSTLLGWHYRSRSESLISFSNWAFYDGRLLTVPDQRLPTAAGGGLTGCDLLLDRPLSFHFQSGAVYANRRNSAEADYIARLVRDLLARQTGLSIGVIAFSEAQQDEINSALNRMAQEDEQFRQRYEEELQREEDNQFIGLLVKNLENIQGDERDVIILSICYGPGPDGKMLMNFGPINQSGGEKRLNVAFSRAKRHMAVVSSIKYSQITNDYNEGANSLKNYLRYAESLSSGDVESAQRVLSGLSRWREIDRRGSGEAEDPALTQIAAALREKGYEVDESVGQSHFRVDLAVRSPGDSEYRLGILVDTFTHYEQSEPLERDMMRPRLLRSLGWKITGVLAKDWYEDPTRELQRVLELLK